MRAPLTFIVVLVLGSFAHAEDIQLRTQAVQLLNAARAANTIRGGAFFIRTEASFVATSEDGSLKSGSYTRTRVPTGGLKQELRFGDWQATSIFVDSQQTTLGPWDFPPFAVRRLLHLVPFQVGQFDANDVVRAIRDGSARGQAATCVDYDTVHGEARSSNELCVNKADGTLLTVREEDRSYEYSKYSTVAGAAYPQHIEYREGTSFTLSVDLTMTRLDGVPDNTFALPEGARTTSLCKSFTAPVPIHAPQPEARGGANAPIADVSIRLYITGNGSVSQPTIIRSARPELDAEALKLVQTWTFQAPTCNGQPNTIPADVVLHFQGR